MTENTMKKKWKVEIYQNITELEYGLNSADAKDWDPVHIVQGDKRIIVAYIDWRV